MGCDKVRSGQIRQGRCRQRFYFEVVVWMVKFWCDEIRFNWIRCDDVWWVMFRQGFYFEVVVGSGLVGCVPV